MQSGYVAGEEERSVAFNSYLFALVLSVITCGSLGAIGPIVALAMAKQKGPFAIFHANQIFWLTAIVGILNILLGAVSAVFFCIAIITLPVMGILGIGAFIFTLMTMLKAKEGVWAEIPMVGQQVLDSDPLLK